LAEQEYACEYVRENCYCDDANDDDVCEATCYTNAGLDYCVDYEGEDDFEIQRYLECAELENKNGNNNNNNNNGNAVVYYVGPTCSEKDGKSIFMAVFTDQGCSAKAEDGIYESMTYGSTLPYSTEPIVQSECTSCTKQDDNNNNNNNNNGNYEISELCENSYQSATRCEEGLDLGQYFYPDNSGCTYIKTILPKIEKATRSSSTSASSSKSEGKGAAVTFAVLFAFTSVILGAYSFFLYRKIHRAKVNLAHSEGMTAA